MTNHAANVKTDALRAALEGAGELVLDPAVLASYRHDQAPPEFAPAGQPRALVRPRTTGQVQAAVSAARRLGLPVVARGAGSGLSGAANAIDGCLVVGLERMAAPVDVDRSSLTATAQPGVLNEAVRAAAAAEGLWYAPDPASHDFSTIGGNVATNAGGLCCVKYGVTRDALLGLEVVLADGRAVRLGRRTRKGVAGYDLVSLLCGSEGTLGIVTEATLRLIPRPRPAVTVAASFGDLGAAGRAIAAIAGTLTPSLLEVMDATTIAAVERFEPIDIGEETAALLFAASDAGGATGREEAARMSDLCDRAGATLTVVSEDEAEGRMLTAARRLAYPALERLGATLLDDVAVPVGRIAELLDGIPPIGERHGVTIGTFGHAGDGNMHPTIVYPREDPDAADRALAAFDAILALAGELGGTITGEHGVGLLKRRQLAGELGPAHDVHRAVKRALDPEGVLNPGRAI